MLEILGTTCAIARYLSHSHVVMWSIFFLWKEREARSLYYSPVQYYVFSMYVTKKNKKQAKSVECRMLCNVSCCVRHAPSTRAGRQAGRQAEESGATPFSPLNRQRTDNGRNGKTPKKTDKKLSISSFLHHPWKFTRTNLPAKVSTDSLRQHG